MSVGSQRPRRVVRAEGYLATIRSNSTRLTLYYRSLSNPSYSPIYTHHCHAPEYRLRHLAPRPSLSTATHLNISYITGKASTGLDFNYTRSRFTASTYCPRSSTAEATHPHGRHRRHRRLSIPSSQRD